MQRACSGFLARVLSHRVGRRRHEARKLQTDDYNEWDPWWKPSLTVRLDPPTDRDGRRVQHAVFDVVLQRK